MIHTYCVTKSFVNCLIPWLIFWAFTFLFSPLISCVITYWVRSFLNNEFFVRSCVLETSVSSETIWFLFWFRFFMLFLIFLDGVKCSKCRIEWVVGSWGWLYWVSFLCFLILITMFFCPIFICSFVHSYFYNMIVRIICSTSWWFIS